MFNWFIKKTKEKCEIELFFKKNVQAVGIGCREKNGKQTKEKCIICFVDRKLPETQLLAEEKIPSKIGGLFGCRTDVRDIGEIEITNIHRAKMRPAQGGISISHPIITAGTLGAKVYKNNESYLLSNAHVVFPHYLGAKKGDECWQPGRIDSKPIDLPIVIGTTDDVVEIKPQPEINLADAAIVKIEDKDVSNEQLGLGQMGTQITRAKVGDIVIKSSRTSGVNEGKVIATNVLSRVRFNWRDSEGKIIKRVIYFGDQVFLSQNPVFTRGGDSGSAVFLKKTKQPCGLIFAGSPRVGVMNNLDNVCRLLNITFTPPAEKIEGYIALSQRFSTDKIILARRLNFRTAPKIANNVIRRLLRGTKIEVISYAGFASGWHWMKIRC